MDDHAPMTFTNAEGKTVTRMNLSIAEFCHLEGLPLSTFELHRKNGGGPRFRKVGRRLLLPVAEARRYWRATAKEVA